MRASGSVAQAAARPSASTGAIQRLALAFVDERPVAPERVELRREELLLAGDDAAAIGGDAGPAPAGRAAGLQVDRAHALGGGEDRAVAGAAAQVARQRVVGRLARRRMRVLVQAEQAHREAGRAEAALRPVALDERLLHRMERARRGAQALDGEHGLAVERGEETDAGVDRLPGERAVAARLGDDDRARAAVALGAAFLRAGELPRLAQPGKKRRLGRRAGDVDALAVQHEADRVVAVGGHGRRRCAGNRAPARPGSSCILPPGLAFVNRARGPCIPLLARRFGAVPLSSRGGTRHVR